VLPAPAADPAADNVSFMPLQQGMEVAR
jgi:hypothetical protein